MSTISKMTIKPTTWAFLFFACLGLALIFAGNTIPEPPKDDFEKSKQYHINRILLNVFGGISFMISGIFIYLGYLKNEIVHADHPSALSFQAQQDKDLELSSLLDRSE